MVDADAYPPGIRGQIIDTIGHCSAEFLDQESCTRTSSGHPCGRYLCRASERVQLIKFLRVRSPRGSVTRSLLALLLDYTGAVNCSTRIR